jgi:predicted Fe-Mo cluster-binding NifX family protein
VTQRIVLAIPSLGEGGLDGVRSGHLGHCDCFTLVEFVGDEILEVRIVDNPPHEEGGCLRPVDLLASQGVSALLAAGMGARPLAGFNRAGVSVYFESQTPRVGDAARLVIDGSVEMMDARHTCGGH